MSASLCWIAWNRRCAGRTRGARARTRAPRRRRPARCRPPARRCRSARRRGWTSRCGSRGSPRRAAGPPARRRRRRGRTVDDEFSPSFSSSRVTSTCAASSTNARRRASPPRLVGAREEQERAGERAVGDPLLRAGDVPAVRRPLGLRDQRARVGARAGLGQRERADRLAARERRHEARALLLGAEGEQRQRAGGRVHRDRDADARVGTRELLEREDVREEVRPRPAVLLRHAHAQQAQLGQLREQLAREAVRAVPLRGVRRDLGVANSRVSAWISR